MELCGSVIVLRSAHLFSRQTRGPKFRSLCVSGKGRGREEGSVGGGGAEKKSRAEKLSITTLRQRAGSPPPPVSRRKRKACGCAGSTTATRPLPRRCVPMNFRRDTPSLPWRCPNHSLPSPRLRRRPGSAHALPHKGGRGLPPSPDPDEPGTSNSLL